MKKTSTIHKAGWIVVDPWTILRDGFVKVESGWIKEVGKGNSYRGEHVIDHGPGVIFPGLVNGHTHLELSALKEHVCTESGFQNWVRELIQQRDEMPITSLCNGAKTGIRELLESGCFAVGEVSTLGITQEIFVDSELSGVWFREFLGDASNENMPVEIRHNHKMISVAGHAPHSTSPFLLKRLKNAASRQKLPFTLHLAESEEEDLFLRTGRGEWAEFLRERGIDFSAWGLPVQSPVQYMEDIGILDENTIVVHLVFSDKADFEILLKHHACACLCVRSNYRLHQKLPDLQGMLDAGLKPCLGTDSLASVETLSMLDEMAFVSKKFPSISPAEILAMATVNGSKCLGISDGFGSLKPNKKGSFVYMPVEVYDKKSVLDAVVNGSGECKIVS